MLLVLISFNKKTRHGNYSAITTKPYSLNSYKVITISKFIIMFLLPRLTN